MESESQDISGRWAAGVADAHGSSILRVLDVDAAARELAGHLDAELVEGADGLEEAVARRTRELADRVSAHTALALSARERDAVRPEPRVLTDIVGLRALIARIDAADELVESSREDAQARAGAASGLAVHPSSIRAAADDVVDARTQLAECQRALDTMTERPADDDASPADDAPTDPAGARPDRLRVTDRAEIARASLVTVAAAAVGVLVLVLTGSPLALVFPGVAVCWVVVLVVRQRDDAYDEEIASRNLANMSSLTDRAYGGAGLGPDDDTDYAALDAARRAVNEATDRLAYAESSWRSLVGPDADVDDVESVVQARDAQFGLGEAVVAEVPSVRAAQAHVRRLRAQWKLAFWAIDRPPPPLEPLDVARDAVDELEAAGTTEITVELHVAGGLSPAERERLAELSGGRDEDALRSAAERSFPPVVVVDGEGSIDDERFRSAVDRLPDDVRVVVVAPAE